VAAVLGALVALAAVAAFGRRSLHGGRVQLSRGVQDVVVLGEEGEEKGSADAASVADVQALKDNVTSLQKQLRYVMERFPAKQKTGPMVMPAPSPTHLGDLYLRPLGPGQKYCGVLPVPVNATCCNGIAGAPFSTCCAGSIVCDRGSTCCGSICCAPEAVCCNGVCGAPNAKCTADKIVLAPMIKPTQSPRKDDGKPYRPPLEDPARQKYCGELPVPKDSTCCNGIAGAPGSVCCSDAIVCDRGAECCGSICCAPEAVCCNGICGAPNANCTADKIVLAPMIKPTSSPRSTDKYL
jgi:hypothetical protein